MGGAPPAEEKENGPPSSYTTPELQTRALASTCSLSTGNAAETPGWNAGLQGWNAGGNPLATPTIGLMG